MTDWRALCKELHLALERRAETLEEDRLLDRSAAALRAARAQPEPEVVEPTDEELLSLWGQAILGLAKGSTQAAVNLAFARAAIAADRARYGRPAPAPDDRGVLPMIVSETGADDEPELERIICASISGGADYVNSMPRELRLERITPEGSTFARYVQVDAGTRFGGRPAPAAEVEVAELVRQEVVA